MQRKCNLSLYSRKSQERKTCLYCNKPLQGSISQRFFCSSECLSEWQAAQREEKPYAIDAVRRSEIPKDEWQLAAEVEDTSDDALWVNRAHYWETQSKAQIVRRKWARTKTIEARPLILTGHGVRLRIDHGALSIKNGFTCYPQTCEEWRLFPGDRKSVV